MNANVATLNEGECRHPNVASQRVATLKNKQYCLSSCKGHLQQNMNDAIGGGGPEITTWLTSLQLAGIKTNSKQYIRNTLRIKAHLNGTKLAMYEEYKFCDAVVLRTMGKLRHPTCHECHVMFGDVAILLYPHISI